MNREKARDELKGYLRSYLEEVHGVNVQRPFRCLSPDHRDEHPSMSFDKAHNRVHCFACGFSADIIDLIRIDQNLSTERDAFDWGYEHYRIDVDKPNSTSALSSYRRQQTGQTVKDKRSEVKGQDFTAYLKQCADRMEGSPGLEYLRRRGLHSEVIERFGIGYDPTYSVLNQKTGQYEKWNMVIIPTGPDSFTARNIGVWENDEEHKKDRVRKKGPSRPFNLSALSEDEPVFIVEGEIDALSVMECGGQAVGLGSASNVDAFLRYIDDNKINPLHPLQLCLDNDDEGKDATRKLAEGLGRRGIPFRAANVSEEYKDPNEALIKDEFSLIGLVHEAESQEEMSKKQRRDEYFKISGAGSMVEFLNEVEHNKKTPPVGTGFLGLDNCLGGGLYEGLYVLGAISSLGKTDFILQVADNVARGDGKQEGRDVLIIALEMSRFELMARSISRETFEAVEDAANGVAKTTREILNGQGHELFNDADLKAIQNAEAAYCRYANHLFFVEGLGNIGWAEVKDAVKKHIEITGQVPIVIVDYLQLLAPDDPRATDKQNIDKTILELKRISRDFRTPVIAISSFNRVNYKTSAAMEAFKESGAIEYSADVLIGLQLEGAGKSEFDVDAAKKENPRQVEAVILKHRSGRTGDKLRFSFFPAYHFFDEEFSDIIEPDKVRQRREFIKTHQEAAKKDAIGFYGNSSTSGHDIKLSKEEQSAWEAFKKAVVECRMFDDNGEFCGLKLEAWRPVFRKYSTASGDKAKDRQFDKARDVLKKAGLIRVENDVYWPDGDFSVSEIRAIIEKLKVK